MANETILVVSRNSIIADSIIPDNILQQVEVLDVFSFHDLFRFCFHFVFSDLENKFNFSIFYLDIDKVVSHRQHQNSLLAMGSFRTDSFQNCQEYII